MASAWLLITTLAAAPPPIKLAAPGLTGVNVTDALTSFATENLAEQLNARGLQVTTAREITQLLGFERQKQLLGCSDASSSCAVELANALGVDALLTGELALLGGQYHLELKVIAAGEGRRLAGYSGLADGEEVLSSAIWQAADALAHQTATALGREATLREPPPRVMARSGQVRRWSWVPGAAGLVFVGAGAAALALAKSDYDQIASGQIPTLAGAQPVRRDGETLQVLGVVGVGLGAAALIASGAMFSLGGQRTVQVAVLPGVDGMSVTGVFP